MSTYIMTSRLSFPSTPNRRAITLNFLESVRIESSWKLLTDTATITLPRKVIQRLYDKHNIKQVFRRGDPVRIALGYNGDNIEQFSGYITEVSADIPIQLKCEDEMYRLKQLPVNYSAKNASLSSLLTAIVPNYTIEANEGEQLGAVRFAETTVSQVLEKLQQDKNIYSYFDGDKLVSGKVYADNVDAPLHRFQLERNAVSNNLQYRRGEDIKILIIARAIVNGKKTEYKIGENGGDVYKLNYTSSEVIALEDLQRKAEADYNNLKADGFDGSFTAFGIPSVQHGDRVDLSSRLYEDRSGQYYVEGVTKTFSKSGYRQEIKLEGSVI